MLAETVSTSETNTDTRGWIEQALEGDMPGSLIDLNDPIAKAYQLRSWQKDSTGFRATDRRFYIRLAPFRKFIDFHVERRTGQKDITTRLARLGFEEGQIFKRAILKIERRCSPPASGSPLLGSIRRQTSDHPPLHSAIEKVEAIDAYTPGLLFTKQFAGFSGFSGNSSSYTRILLIYED